MSPATEHLWTEKQLRAFLGLGRSTLSPLIVCGAIPCVWIGRSRRFVPDEVREWALAQRRRPGAQVTHPGRQSRKVA
jgi:hypothetical protein